MTKLSLSRRTFLGGAAASPFVLSGLVDPARAADIMTEINAIHPFREGNGRTRRVFMEDLAKQAGHSLDFMCQQLV